MEKILSVTKAEVMEDTANGPTMVTTGSSDGRKACLNTIKCMGRPLARAVRM